VIPRVILLMAHNRVAIPHLIAKIDSFTLFSAAFFTEMISFNTLARLHADDDTRPGNHPGKPPQEHTLLHMWPCLTGPVLCFFCFSHSSLSLWLGAYVLLYDASQQDRCHLSPLASLRIFWPISKSKMLVRPEHI
jgi:hypothetical protein